MGKTKKSGSKPHKKNPTGLSSLASLDIDENPNSSRGPIVNIIEQLQSASNDEKMCGLQTLSTLCQREQNIKGIMNSEIIRIVFPLLVDKDENIRHACAGSLRNLAAVSADVCEKLVELDIFTPLQTLLNEYANSEWTPIIDGKANILNQKSDTFLQAINIVWNLCESTSVALDFFNQSQLLQSLMRCLNHEVFGIEIAISVAQCLLVISEDNPSSWKILGDYASVFQNILKINGGHKEIILRTVIAGVCSNVPILSMQNLSLIIEALSKTVEVNHRQILNELTSRLPINEGEVGQKETSAVEIIDEEMDEETETEASARRLREDMPTELDNDIKDVGYLLLAQRIAAEVLTNICSTEDNEMSEGMEDSDPESVHDYDVSEQQNGNQVTADKISTEISEAIQAHKIVEKLWERSQPLPENVRGILFSTERDLFKRQNSMRVASLLCLHNLCNALTTEELGGPSAIYKVWLDLGQQIFQIQQDYESLEASTSLMRATLEHLKNSPELFQQVSDSDLQLILDGIQNCDKSEVRANWLRMLGILGCLLPEALVKKITQFILETTLKEDDVWTISEALDSFMDMFSDNDWNQIVNELNVISKSKELEKILKTKIKQRRRELGDRYSAVITIKTNFSRFCKYLEQQQKNFIPSH